MKERRSKELGGTRTLPLRLNETTPNHCTTEAGYVIFRKRLSLYSFSMKLPPARWSPAALTELLTVKKQCKRIFHGNEWKKKHNYAFQNADTRPRLQSRTKNICFVISISAVILKRMVKITSTFGSNSFLNSTAWHFLTITSPSSKLEFVYPPVLRSRRANAHLLVRFNTWTSQRLLNCNPIPKLTIVLIWKTPACLKIW